MLDDINIDIKTVPSKSTITYDINSKEKNVSENHILDADNKKVKELTLKELKIVIQEVIREELSKINFPYIPNTPSQPYYGVPNDPWWIHHVYCNMDKNV